MTFPENVVEFSVILRVKHLYGLLFNCYLEPIALFPCTYL